MKPSSEALLDVAGAMHVNTSVPAAALQVQLQEKVRLGYSILLTASFSDCGFRSHCSLCHALSLCTSSWPKYLHVTQDGVLVSAPSKQYVG